jgi:acetolactate synthase-1/2/3 large subunit
VRTAFEIARTGRPGPVVIDVPKDVQNWQGPFRGAGQLPVRGYRQRMSDLVENALDDAACREFFEMLGRAERPLIYAGGGVIQSGGSEAMRAFANDFGIPVVTTLMGIGAFDTTSPLSMRMLGMHGAAFANYAVDDCDFLLCLGARFDDRVAAVPKKFARNARRIAHLDIDASEINKVKRVQWSHVGLLRPAIETLHAHGRRADFKRDWSAWHAHLEELKQRHAMNYDRDSELIQPYYVIEEINRLTRGEAIITTGVGQHQMWAAQYFDFREPRCGSRRAAWARWASDCRPRSVRSSPRATGCVIDVDGDASIRMNLGELETVTTYDLPIKVLVHEQLRRRHGQAVAEAVLQGRLSASDKSLHKKDFVEAAQADGFRYAERLDRKADVPASWSRVHRVHGPAFPRGDHRPRRRRLPDGRARPGYEEMITGDHIASRTKAEAARTGESEMF